MGNLLGIHICRIGARVNSVWFGEQMQMRPLRVVYMRFCLRSRTENSQEQLELFKICV